MAKGLGELRVRNDLKQQQIVDSTMLEENPDWFELAVKVYVKNIKVSQQKIGMGDKISIDFCILVDLAKNKLTMPLMRLKINLVH